MENREAQNCKADSEKAEGSRITRPEESRESPQENHTDHSEIWLCLSKKIRTEFPD